MDCRIFDNKLEDFQKGKLPKDIEKAIEKHMEKCADCRAVYTLEQNMNTSFSAYFGIDQLEHKTVRNEIMKKINKNRYRKNPVKKFKYKILADKKKYMATAAVLLAVCICIPFIKNLGRLSLSNAKTSTRLDSTGASPEYKTENAIIVKDEKQGIQINYYKISKDEAVKMINETYNVTKSVTSPDNKKKALIYGKGEEMIEEGYSKVILQDLTKNEYYVIELNDKSSQLTVKGITWRNNNHILAIIGYAYGMVSKGEYGAASGGNVYDFNLDTRELSLVYKTKDDYTQVISIKRGDEFHYILNLQQIVDANIVKEYQENITLK
ncbi:MAG: DUF4652 domain-containing protein [Clostridiaceae bacterium]